MKEAIRRWHREHPAEPLFGEAAYEKPPGIAVGQGSQQHRIDNAEDCGVGPNAEAEYRDDRDREQRILAQPAQGVDNVAEHTKELVYRVIGRSARSV